MKHLDLVIERTTPWNTTCIWRFFRLNTSLGWCYFLLQDDRYFLSGSLDGKIRLWNIPDKKVALWNEVEGTGNYLHFFSWCLFSTIIFFNSAFWWQFVLNEMSPKRANLDWREVPPFHWGPSPKNKKKLVKKKNWCQRVTWFSGCAHSQSSAGRATDNAEKEGLLRKLCVYSEIAAAFLFIYVRSYFSW